MIEKRPTWATKTQSVIESVMVEFASFVGDRPLGPIVLDDYIRWLKKTHADSTAANRWSFVASFLKWCFSKRHIDAPIHMEITERIPTRRITKREFYSRVEYEELKRRAAGHWMKYAIIIAYNTGLRMSDIATLRWENIDLKRQIISLIPLKTIRMRTAVTIPFLSDGEVMKVLLEMKELAGSSPFVCPPMAAKCSPETGNRVLSMYVSLWMRTNGFPGKTFHTFRRTFLTNMMSSGVDSVIAMNIAGITRVDILRRYVVPTEKMLLSAIRKATDFRNDNL